MSLRVGVFTALLVASSAFGYNFDHGRGHHHGKGHGKGHHVSMDGDYTGGGWWKSADGSKGKFEMTSTVKTGKDEVTVKEAVVIHMPDKTEKKMEEEMTYKSTGNGFFEVQKKGTKVGTGYCGIKQCHFDGDENGDAFEETVTFHEGKIYKLGSHVSKDMTVAWQGSLTKKAAKKGKCGGCDCDKCDSSKCSGCDCDKCDSGKCGDCDCTKCDSGKCSTDKCDKCDNCPGK